MADYYWVGGAGTWDASTTTNWAASSGGAGGAGVPTLADNAYFDGGSDTGTPFTVTLVTGAVCRDFIVGDGTTVTALDQAMTLAGTADISVYGSLFFPASNFTTTQNGRIRFQAASGSHTVTTNNISLLGPGSQDVTEFGGSGTSTATWTLGSNLTTTGYFGVFSGTVNTANYNITCALGPRLRGTGTKTLVLGSSTVTTSGQIFTCLEGAGPSNTTLNAGTSTITSGTAAPALCLNVSEFEGFTFYNVTFTSVTANQTGNIYGTNTFNNLSFAGPSGTGTRTLTLHGNQTVNGALTISGATAVRRIRLQSNSIGASKTVTLNGSLTALINVDFRGIVAAGTVGTWTGTRLSDLKGNSNITFDAAKTVYRVGTGNWSDTQWSLSSGGGVDINNFPLAQDTAVFDAGTVTGTHTFNQSWQVGTLTMTASTTVTLAFGTTTPTFYGSLTLSSAVTPTGTGTLTFAGRTTQIVTSAGKTFDQPFTIDTPSGTVSFADALTQGSTRAFTLTNGTVELAAGATSTVGAFATSGTAQKYLRSTSPGVQATLSQASGTVTVTNLTITDIAATGGATWTALAAQGNVDDGNNTGWDFGPSVVTDKDYVYNLRSFTERRSF